MASESISDSPGAATHSPAERLAAARQRMELALSRLEATAEQIKSGDTANSSLERQVQHLTVDRGRMAQELDALKSDNRTLLQANTEAVGRIDNAISAVEALMAGTAAQK